MRKFLSKLATFLIPLLLVMYLLDFTLSNSLKQSNQNSGEMEVWNDIYNGNASCDFAIYGNSRAWVHVDPEIISDSLNQIAYNFGIDGHNFWLQYLRHLELIKHNKKPKTILISVDVFSLQKRDDLYNLNQFIPFMLWNENISEYTSSYKGFHRMDYYIPFVRYYGKKKLVKSILLDIFKDKENKFLSQGFRGMNLVWNDDFDRAKETMEKYEVVLDEASIKLFEKFIVECKDSHTELILVYAPEYIEGQSFIKNRKEIINIYADLSQKYHLLFLDYSNSVLSQNKNLFYNATHMNAKGADQFTRMLSSDLLKNKELSAKKLFQK